MGAQTTKEVAWLTGAAKDDNEALFASSTGTLASTSFTVASLLANDPGSATFYGIYGTATPYSNASTKTPMDPSSGLATTALGGTVCWNKTTGTINYTPPSSITSDILKALPAGATINDTFYYVIWMGNKGAYSIAQATVQLTGIDDAANITGGMTGAVVEDVTTTAGGTLSIVDPDTGESGFHAASLAGAYGTLTLTPVSLGSGSTPGTATWGYALDHNLANSLAEGEQHTETFTLSSIGGTTVTVTITVTGTNDGPTAVADAASTGENTAVSIDALANDTDPDHNHVLSLVSAAAPTGQGTATVQGGKVVFDPGTDFDHLAQGATATVNVTYTMQDEHGATSTSTITVTVNGENDGPTAVADTASTGENTPVTIDAVANDTDPDDGHVLSLVSVSPAPSGGSASIVDGKVVFDPGADFDHLAQGATATFNLTYVMTDEFGATSSSTITVTVNGENDGPTAVADAASTGENTPVSVDVVANDTDPDDGHVLSLVSVSPAPHGTASVVDGKVSFDPGTAYDHLAQGSSETFDLTYVMEDEHGATSSSTVTITVNGENDTPTAAADTATTGENTAVTIDALANDTDPDDGHTLSLVSVSPPAHGTASIVNGQVAFDPGTAFDHLVAGATEVVSFTYLMQDEYGATSSSTVAITVVGENDPASISGGATGAVTEDGTIAAGGSLSVSDVDDGQSVFAAVPTASLHGTYGDFTFDATTGAWGYTLRNGDANVQALATGQQVMDTLTVHSLDGTASQDIVVTVNGADEPNPVTTYIVNHGQDTVLGHTTITGFDFNDVLKVAGDLTYDGFTVKDVNGDGILDTVVSFHYVAGNGVSGGSGGDHGNGGDNGNGGGVGNNFATFEVQLLGYTQFDPGLQIT